MEAGEGVGAIHEAKLLHLGTQFGPWLQCCGAGVGQSRYFLVGAGVKM